MRSLQSDGTDAPVAGAGVLPDPTDDGDVLTVVEGEWVGAPGGGSGPYGPFVVSAPVSSAEILEFSFDDTPKVLIEGVPGFVIVVTGTCFIYLKGATPYDPGEGGNIEVQTREVTLVWGGVPGPGFIDAPQDMVGNGLHENDVGYLSDAAGANVLLGYTAPNPTEGDGTLVVTVTYYLAPVS